MEQPNLTEIPSIAATCDGGDLDCGSGLLLIIRQAMAGVAPGEVLEIRSRERSVQEDLPAWCRMTQHEFLGVQPTTIDTRYFVRRGQPAGAQENPLEAELEKARTFTWTARVRRAGALQAQVFEELAHQNTEPDFGRNELALDTCTRPGGWKMTEALPRPPLLPARNKEQPDHTHDI